MFRLAIPRAFSRATQATTTSAPTSHITSHMTCARAATALRFTIAGLALLGAPATAWAADELDTGDTAWILTSTALVLFMTIPGLALFYGGLVRTRRTCCRC